MLKTLLVVLVFVFAAFGADFEYSTAGTMGTVPDLGGSSTGWGEWFITSILNDSGHDLLLTQISIPCCGPATGDYGWIVWTDVGGLTPPAGDATTADYHGPFTPVDPSSSTLPPVTYTDIDISAAGVVIPSGNYFCVGYDVTGNGGQIAFNGVDTWSWYSGMWDSDQGWGRTDIIDVYANFDTALTRDTWASIKNSF